MGETLKKTLRKLDPGQKIKVGAKEATSFFYVGTVDDLLDNIQVYNAYCKLHIEKTRKRAEDLLKSTIANYPTLADYAKSECLMTKPRLNYDGYIKVVNEWFNSVKKLNERKERKSVWDNEFIKLPDREVLEVAMCDPTSDYNVMRIIIRGHEYGKYWTADEAPKIPSCAFAIFDEQGDEDCQED